MSAAETVRVVVAPGESVTITPHPSGLPQLRSLTLAGGEGVRVSPERAERLVRVGQVLDPATGRVRPPPVHSAPPPLIQRTGESWQGAAHRAEEEKQRAGTPAARPVVLDPWSGRRHFEPTDPRTTPQHIDLAGGPRIVEVDRT